jgi:hypothetical protein
MHAAIGSGVPSPERGERQGDEAFFRSETGAIKRSPDFAEAQPARRLERFHQLLLLSM